ncbi:MAG: hypothetical protein ACKESB_02895 [Candidatus Hodgkinia cicadicola]
MANCGLGVEGSDDGWRRLQRRLTEFGILSLLGEEGGPPHTHRTKQIHKLMHICFKAQAIRLWE